MTTLAAMLALEAERYLAAVDLFRAEGCDPTWRADEWSVPPRRNRSRRGRASDKRRRRVGGSGAA